MLQRCYLYVPDLDGTYVPHSATIHTDKKTAADILKSFKQAEDALKREDLDSLMDFYADHYKHGGFTKDSLRAEWKALFEQYRALSATHVLTRIEVAVDADKVPLTAQVTCTGGSLSDSNDSNHHLDSRYNEINYDPAPPFALRAAYQRVAYVDCDWRIQVTCLRSMEYANSPSTSSIFFESAIR